MIVPNPITFSEDVKSKVLAAVLLPMPTVTAGLSKESEGSVPWTELCPPPHSYGETLVPSVTVFGDGALGGA